MTDRSFERANEESRDRLARMVSTLTPVQLETDLGEGWTVASALAHAGFWDRWQAARWTEMLAGDWSAEDVSVLAAEHLANEALHPYWAGISAAYVPTLALDAATRLNSLIAQAPDALVDSLEGGPSAFLLHRHRHRNDHLDHIERVLAATAQAAGSVDRAFVQRNTDSRQRLSATVMRLEVSDLELSAEADGWTIGQVLGHLGFWDRFLAARWQSALASGPGAQPAYLDQGIADLLNEALAPAWGATDAGTEGPAVLEILAAAQAVDDMIAGLPAETPIEAILAERPSLLDRSLHRREHLDVIDRALAGRIR